MNSEIINPLQDLAGYNLRRASNIIILPLEESLRDINISIVSATLLILIEANPGVTQSQLGREVAIKSSNMTPLVLDLLGRELIERERNDGRSYGLFIAGKGKTKLKKVWRCILESEARQSNQFSRAEWKQLVCLLQKVWK